jgi:hypothetical protein
VTQDLDGLALDDFGRFGVGYDLRAGWGLSDAIVVFASVRGGWFRYDTAQRDDSDILHGVLGVGMTQHFAGGRSDWYSTGHLGWAFFELLDESADALTGFGFGAGIGRTWREHFGMECIAGWETTGTSTGFGEFETGILSVRVQLVAVAY